MELARNWKSVASCALMGATTFGSMLVSALQADAAVVQARKSEDFVDSVGVCLHVQNFNDSQWNTVKTQLGTLGVKYFRDGLEHVDNATFKARLQSLYDSYGMKMLAVTGPYGNNNLQPINGTLDHIRAKVNAIKPMVLAVEGPNEPEFFWHDPWNYGGFTTRQQQVVWYQNTLYDALKKTNVTDNVSDIPITSPAMARGETYGNYGWLSSKPAIKHDILAWHYYNGRYLPTPYDWLNNARNAFSSGSKPTYLTEHGYRVAGDGNVTQKGQMKLNTRSMAFFFNNPDAVNSKMFFYVAGPDGEDYGLSNPDYTPRPTYNAIKSVVGYLKESSWNASSKTWSAPNFTPSSLDFTLSGDVGGYGWRLLQKSNGEFYLLTLPYYQVSDPNTGADYNNATHAATLSFPTGKKVVRYQCDDSGNYSETTLTTGATSVNITLNDTLQIWKISNGGTVSTVPLGQRIGFKSTANSRFVSSNLNDSSFLVAQWATGAGSWEKFDVVDAGSGQVALKSAATGKYVSCDMNTAERRLRADWSTGIGSWERFIWEDRGSSNFALKSVASGRYVSADLNVTQKYLKAQWATSVGAWENFQWVSAP